MSKTKDYYIKKTNEARNQLREMIGELGAIPVLKQLEEVLTEISDEGRIELNEAQARDFGKLSEQIGKLADIFASPDFVEKISI